MRPPARDPALRPGDPRAAALAEPPPRPVPDRPVAIEDYITALNFPDSPDDAQGIQALRRVLAHDSAAKLIRAAQDMLTLLAQDGIFMDDLPADPVAGAEWRRFAKGAGGAALAEVGAFADVMVMERAAGRMEADQVFRDAAHHFLRQFDRSLQAFAQEADDADLAALGHTRTARAFVLLGTVAGTFD